MSARKAATLLPFIAWGAGLASLLAVMLLSPTGLAGAATSPEGIDLSRTARLGGNSLYVAAMAAMLALFWSAIPALVAAHIERGAMRAILVSIVVMPIFIAPSVLSVVAVRLLGAQGYLANFALRLWPGSVENELRFAPVYTLTGTAATLACAFLPVAFLGGLAALLKGGRVAREAALLETTPARALLRAVLPLGLPGFAAGASLVFLLAITEFSVPEALRVQPVLASDVYTRFGVNYNGQAAALSALVLIAIALAALQLVLVLFRQQPGELQLLAEDDRSSPPLRSDAGYKALRFAGWLVGVLPALAIAAVLVYTLRGPAGYVQVIVRVWKLSIQEFVFSLQIAGMTAILCAVSGLLFGSLLATMRRPLAARLLLLTGFILPGPVTGMALKMMLLLPPGSLPFGIDDWLAHLDGTLAPLLTAYWLRFTPLTALLCEYQLRRVPREWIDAARLETSGVVGSIRVWGWFATWPAVLGGALAIFALALGEAGSTVILIPPGPTTLSIRLMTLMHYAPTAEVSALCLLIALPSLAILPAFVLLARLLTLGRRPIDT